MKKLVALIISLSLILVPCYAFADTASGSALTLNEQLWIMNEGGIKPVQVAAIESGAIKAAGDPGSSTNPYYFLSVGRNATLYYATNSTNSTSTSYYVDDLGDVVQGISQSIAYSIQTQRNLWSTIGTNTVSAINDVWNRLGTIDGHIDGLEGQMTTNNTRLGTIDTAVGNIKSKVDSIYSAVDNVEGYTDDIESSLSSILSAILNQSLTIPQSLLDDVDSLATYQTKPSDLYAWLNPGYGKFDQYYVTPNTWTQNYRLYDITSSTSYLFNLLSAIILNGNTATAQYNNALWRGYQNYLDDNLVSQQGSFSNSYNSSFIFYFQRIQSDLKKLRYVLASDDDIAARQAAAANTAAAVSNVISSSGPGSASTSDISGIANLKTSVSDSISTGASASTVFNELGSDGNAWGWFSQACQDELSAPSRRSNVRSNRKSSSSDTPYLDAYYHDLEEALGFKLW